MSYIPKGCDQQGRYPERVESGQRAPDPAEAATDLGVEDPQPPEHDMFMVVLKDVAIAVTILVVIHALLLWVIYG